ncbi:hypothetical protein B0I72DRAFT_134574 [Yarrowia lipolytica]|jgi:hypothetical protein|uniref:Uncharacterized protein n=1 Tax=Yarrowia lipolytica TaxID=4952 RepID=A0A371C9S1_YARLL|nr:hypothetical protein BKA91DRAFT_133494 [Yarrowia lipolytica]KAE8174892.1 hypothetical protein BKA90DRAFT_133087 [Yarrowia lipolytica]RDW27047.1 hypothetical protein B0I71DRAFT_129747 [Yarrowia lipolytica]RDW34547.1 hypothetical protein B0I72DRAFT_134574 [Yarrowia lipolytica]RDW39335.1 hypothetical protein B0I73DRAFT_132213 [Yarrowia lipolytica]
MYVLFCVHQCTLLVLVRHCNSNTILDTCMRAVLVLYLELEIATARGLKNKYQKKESPLKANFRGREADLALNGPRGA